MENQPTAPDPPATAAVRPPVAVEPGAPRVWNPTQPDQWPPLWVRGFRRLLGTGISYAVLWIVFAAPLAYAYDGPSGLPLVFYAAIALAFASFYYEWYVPLEKWKEHLSDPLLLATSLIAAAIVLLVTAPVAFVFGGDAALRYVVPSSFLIASSRLLGMRPWRLVVVAIGMAFLGLAMVGYQHFLALFAPHGSPPSAFSWTQSTQLGALLLGSMGAMHGGGAAARQE